MHVFYSVVGFSVKLNVKHFWDNTFALSVKDLGISRILGFYLCISLKVLRFMV